MHRLWAPWRATYVDAVGMAEEAAGSGGCFLCDYTQPGDDAKRYVLRRWSHWYAVLNAYPYTNGHLMLALGRHRESFCDLNVEEAAELAGALASSERALRSAYEPHGINVGVNMGPAAGAGAAGHLHVHLLPRWHGDTNFMSAVADTRVVPESLERSFERLQGAWGGGESS